MPENTKIFLEYLILSELYLVLLDLILIQIEACKACGLDCGNFRCRQLVAHKNI